MNSETNGPETTAIRRCSACTFASGNWSVIHAPAPVRASRTCRESTHRPTHARLDPEVAHPPRRHDRATGLASVSDALRAVFHHPLSRVRQSGKRRDSRPWDHLYPSTFSTTRRSRPSNKVWLHPTAPADTRQVLAQPPPARSTAFLRLHCASRNTRANRAARHAADWLPSVDTTASTRDKFGQSQSVPATVSLVSK